MIMVLQYQVMSGSMLEEILLHFLLHNETFIILADPPSIPDGHSNCSSTVTIIDNDGRLLSS